MRRIIKLVLASGNFAVVCRMGSARDPFVPILDFCMVGKVLKVAAAVRGQAAVVWSTNAIARNSHAVVAAETVSYKSYDFS